MKKKLIITLGMFIQVVVFSLVANILFAGNQFTLPTAPTATEVSYNTSSTAYVTTSTQFVAAYTNTSISRIVLSNSITISDSDLATINTTGIQRDIQIDGQNYTLTFTGNNLTGFFELKGSIKHTFHLKNIILTKTANAGVNAVFRDAVINWDIILENISFLNSVQWKYFVYAPNSNYNLYFRGTMNIPSFASHTFEGVNDVVFETGSTTTIAKSADGLVAFYDDTAPYTSSAYFKSGSSVDIEGSSGYPMFFPWSNFYAYSNSNVNLHKTYDSEGVMDAYGVTPQTYQVDTNATFTISNDNGPAIYDQGNQIIFLSNPGANIKMIGSHGTAIIYFNNANSKVVLDSPSTFNLLNNTTNASVLKSGSNSFASLQILNTDIGIWQTSAASYIRPTSPAPYANATLQTAQNTLQSGSSSVFSQVSGGWNAANYYRIGYSPVPTISVPSTLSIGLNRTQTINPTYTPSNATVTYSSSNTAIATISSSGVVTAKSTGTTQITTTITTSDLVSTTATTTITVTNTVPTLTVPSFIEVNVNGAFNPLAQVSSTDVEDGDITSNVTYSGNYDLSIAGIYPITYSITDFNGNKVTKQQILLVNNGLYKTGNNYIIYANAFSLRVGQVTLNQASILNSANVIVYDKTTGQVSTTTPTVNTGSYGASVGVYPITFTISNDSQASRVVNATVVKGNNPTISIPQNVTINLNSTYDPRLNLSATDTEDGTITSNVQVTNNVKTNIAGVYVTNYSITDSDGNQATTSQIVIVNDGSYQVGSNYIVHANAFTIRKSQVQQTLSSILSHASVKLYTLSNGQEITNSSLLEIVDYGGYTNALGVYTIQIRAINDNVSTLSLQATVEAGNAPVLTVPQFVEVQVGDAYNPMNGVSALDAEQGDMTSEVSVSSQYNLLVGGIYRVQFSVIDNDGNSAIAYQTLLVNDGTYQVGSQTIIQAQNYTQRISQVTTDMNAIATLAGVKVYDQVSGLDITSSTAINLDNLGGLNKTIGTYNVSFHPSTDVNATKTIQVTVGLGNKPTLVVPSFTEISIGTQFDEKQNVVATDIEQGTITSQVTYDLEINASTPAGVYTINYTIIDEDGNQVQAKRIILVNDGTYQAGNTYIISANDFTKRLSLAPATNSEILTQANVIVYDKITGAIVPNVAMVKDLGGYQKVDGDYQITFAILFEQETTIQINAHVIPGNVPYLSYTQFIEIGQNATISLMDYITAYDKEDLDITSFVTFSTNLDTAIAGLYPVTYQVIDTDLNQVNQTMMVLVNDGSFEVGNDTIIQASDYSTLVSNVKTDDASIQNESQVKVFSKLTGQDITNQSTILVDVNDLSAQVGDYNVDLTVNTDQMAHRQIQVNVKGGSAPVLTVPQFSEIPVSQSFDPLSDVQATDSEDDANSKPLNIQYNGTFDTNTAGVYQLEYTVVDSDQNTVTQKRILLVNDGHYQVGDSTIIYGNSFQTRVGQVSHNSSLIQSLANMHVYDKLSGQSLNDLSFVRIVDYGGYTNSVGDYNLTIGLENDVQAQIIIQANVVTGNMPVITTSKFEEVLLNGEFNPTLGLVVEDDEDGNITSKIQYSAFDLSTPGIQFIEYRVTDSDMNTTTFTKVLLVNDGSYQVGNQLIIQAKDFTKRVSKAELSTLIVDGQVTIYDKQTGQETSAPVQVSAPNYVKAVGTYVINYSLENDMNASMDVTATIIAGNAPILTVTPFVEVSLNGSFNPLSEVTISDVEDDLTNQDVTFSTYDLSVAGMQTITYTAIDSDGNEVSQTMQLLVNDGSYQVGNQLIIQAKDFTKRVSKAELSTLIVDGQVTIYDKQTGQETSEPIQVSAPNYVKAVGTYVITYSLENDMNASMDVTATIIAGNAPILTVTPFVEVSLNGSFNPLSEVTISDVEDDLTNQDVTFSTYDLSVAGMQTITYTAIDSDGNEVSQTMQLLVNDGSYQVGDQTIIYALDFTKFVSQVDLSSLLLDAQVKVYDKFSGQEISPTINISAPNYVQTVGTYFISFVVSHDVSASIEIKATVVAGNVPILTVSPFVEIQLSETYLPIDHVSASDIEDDANSIPLEISQAGTVDVSMAGLYALSFTVKDSDGNQVTKNQLVLVNNGQYHVGTSSIIKTEDFTIRTGQVVISEASIIQNANIEVFDKWSGDPLSAIIQVDSYGEYRPESGVYELLVSIFGDLTSQTTITATVTNGQVPTLVTPEFIMVNVNGSYNPIDQVDVSDFEDNQLNVMVDSSSYRLDQPGFYIVQYQVTDTDFNTVFNTTTLLVNDGSYVVGNDTAIQAYDYTIRLGQVPLNEPSVLAQVQIYDLRNGQIINKIPNVQLNDYQATVGTYVIEFQNPEDAQASIQITADVISGNAPQLVVEPFVEVQVGQSFDVMSIVDATDIEDGDIKSRVISTSFNTQTAGIFTINYSITDSDNNTISKQAVILVNDGNYKVGESTIIQASSFQLRVSEYRLDTLIQNANVHMYDKETGLELSLDVTQNIGDYTNVVGTYPIEFSVVNDINAKIIIYGQIVTGNRPALSVQRFIEVQVGDLFNPSHFAQAEDIEDGQLSVVVDSNTYDETSAGLYPITFKTIDVDQNEVQENAVLLVNDGSYVVGLENVIQANGFTIRLGQYDQIIPIQASNVKTYSKTDGTEINASLYVDLSNYQKTLGNHSIKYTVVGDTASIDVDVIIETGNLPTLTAPTFYQVNQNDSFNPLDIVSAFDDEDGNLDSQIQVSNVDTSIAGFQIIEYKVTDSDDNTVNVKTTLLVNDGSYVVGSQYVIQANHFSIRKGQVALTDPLTLANVRVYNLNTGAEVSEAITVDLNGYTSIIGDYTIQFSVTNDALASIDIHANVISGNLPTLSVEAFTEITLGQQIDLMANVEATDNEDGQLNQAVTISGSYQKNSPGIYIIHYEVMDSDGNSVSQNRTILVNDGTYVAFGNKIIHVSDFVLRISEVDLSDSSILNKANYQVYSKVDGSDVTNQSVISIDKGNYQASVGKYLISITLDGHPDYTKVIQAEVISGQSPIIEGSRIKEVSLNASMDLTSDLYASDFENGDITSFINASGYYDTSVAGVYPVTYTVMDNDLNTYSMVRIIVVNDGNYTIGNETILYAKDFTTRIGQATIASIEVNAKVKVNDKYTGEDLTQIKEVVIVDDGGFTQIQGNYHIEMMVKTDSLAKRDIIGSVMEGNIPTLNTLNFKEIGIHSDFNPHQDVSAFDDEDGNITNKIQVTNPVKVNVAGVYIVSYRVNDSDQNIVEAQMVVVVNDGRFVVGDTYILEAEPFTKRISEVNKEPSVIIQMAKAQVYQKLTGLLDQSKSIVVDATNYSSEIGIYDIKLSIQDLVPLELTVKATVISGESPQLSVQPFIETKVKQDINLFEHTSAIDKEDGNLQSKIVQLNHYSIDAPGLYPLKYMVTDSDGNTVYVTSLLLVNDGTYAVGDYYILRAFDFSFKCQTFNITDENIIQASNPVVYSKEDGQIVNQSVMIKDSGGIRDQAGIYNVQLTLLNDPKIKRIILVTAKIDHEPELIVPTYTFIQIGEVFDPLKGVVATDVEDGDLTGQVKISGQVNPFVSDIYKVMYEVNDSFGHRVNKEQVIVVNDGTYVVDNHLVLHAMNFTIELKDLKMSKEAFINLAKVRLFDILSDSDLDASLVKVDLSNLKPEPGTYKVVITYNPVIEIYVTIIDSNPTTPLPKTGQISMFSDAFKVLVFGVYLIIYKKRVD